MSEDVVQPETPEPEPEGVVEVQGAKHVPLQALVSERERIRTAERDKAAKEAEPLKQQLTQVQQQAQQLQAELEALKAQHAPKPPDIPDVSDEEAEKYARRYELFTPNGLDIPRAKLIIRDNREETKRIAAEAAQQAVQPYAETTSVQASRQNFVWAASQKGPDGQPLVDPVILAQEWKKLPAHLTAQGEVAAHILDTAIGIMHRSGKRPPPAPDQEPVFSEAAGGGRPQSYTMDTMAKRLARTAGMTEKDFTASAQAYKPNQTNFLE